MRASTGRYRSIILSFKMLTIYLAFCLALIAFFFAPFSAETADSSLLQNKRLTPSTSASSVSSKKQDIPVQTSPIKLNGKELFTVSNLGGISSGQRAQAIERRIEKVAEDLTIRTDSITTVDADISTDVVSGDEIITSVTDKDALALGRTRQDVARENAEKIRTAVEKYRIDYGRESILHGALYALIATIAFIVIAILLIKLTRKLDNLVEIKYEARIHSIHLDSLEILQVQRVRALLRGMINVVPFLISLIIFYSYLHFVLTLFPWTKPFANQLLGYVLLPLTKIGNAFINEIPNLIFLAVLVLVTRYILKFMHAFFKQIGQGTISLPGFYLEWAKPTSQLLTFAVIVFAAVVAFPYIPGSESPAFKGISIFIGIVFSLGSQSVMSNTVAGMVMTYRRAFKVGDRIKVGEITGDVTEIRHQVTFIRTVKNEKISMPNSMLLASPIINYSALAREQGLILHTAVTIGYDAPWRQIHELLLMAARRTAGLLQEPSPFVLQTSLDDFYVRYELNVYTDTPQNMANLYSDLHKNIQDCFNESGVQIMSPHYLGDPASAKIVPKDKWYMLPARKLGKESE